MASTSQNAMLIDPGAIIAGLESAETQREILALIGQAFANIAQQTGAISNNLDDIVSPGTTGQPSALNIAATVETGSTIDVSVPGSIDANVSGAIGSTVTIDCLSEPAEKLLKEQLSKAAHAVFHLWTMAHTRIGEFEAALDCSIGKVAKEICELKPFAKDIGSHLYDLTVEIKDMKHLLRTELRCICDSAHDIHRCMREQESAPKYVLDQIEALGVNVEENRIRVEQIAAEATAALEGRALRQELEDLRAAMENNAETNRVRMERIEAEANAAERSADVPDPAARRPSGRRNS